MNHPPMKDERKPVKVLYCSQTKYHIYERLLVRMPDFSPHKYHRQRIMFDCQQLEMDVFAP